jgi:hypothetical protein
MDSVAVYVIVQGPVYKTGICQINFVNTLLSSPYVLSVGIIFCLICNNPEMKKKKADTYIAHQGRTHKFQSTCDSIHEIDASELQRLRIFACRVRNLRFINDGTATVCSLGEIQDFCTIHKYRF